MLFVIAEDWFFASHFLALATRIRRQGYEVSVLLCVNDPAVRTRIEACGIRVFETASFRNKAGGLGVLRQICRIRKIFARERPTIVHLISLRMIVVGGLAAIWAGVPVRVQALTGLGYLGTAPGVKPRIALCLIGLLLRHVLGGRHAAFVFENQDDPRRLGIDTEAARVLVVGGAGVDPDLEPATPVPDMPPLRVAIVSRMVHSKGIVVAAEAVGRARSAGTAVTLTLVGNPDSGNPRSLTERDLRTLAEQPGIAWIGHSTDVPAIWRDHHVACVPSLGGEGLPRALLEAATAGRPIVTTTTPGCAAFVRDGTEGLLVPPGDAERLAECFSRLAADPALVAHMGKAARARVREGFTIQQVADAVTRLYALCLQTGTVGRHLDSVSSRQKAQG